MANTILTPQVIAYEALRILRSNILFADLVHKDFSSEFAAKVGDTVNVRKITPLKSKNFQGEIEIDDISQSTVPVKLDRIRDISVAVSSKDMALAISDFGKQILEPMLLGIAQDVDADIAAAAYNYAGKTIAATAKPTDLEDIAKLGKYLDANKAPKNDRSLVFAVDHKYNYALTDNLSKVNYAGDNITLREALLGRVYSFDTYMSQNNVNTEAETAGTATAYKVVGTKGQKTVALSGVNAATGTVKAGDGFIVDGHIYRFTADATAASGAVASVAIDDKLHRDITAADVITLVNKPVSVAFQKEGLAFVTRPLELPQGAARAYVANADGFSVRVVIDYDIKTKEDIISVDILYGLAKLNDKLIVALA
jgi:hypothetical protein